MKRFDLTLLVLLAVGVGVNLRLHPDPEKRNTMIFRDMVYAKGFESYSENPYLPAGATLQTPVPGTVHRGTRPRPQDAAPAGWPANPAAADTAWALARGERVFATFCAVCHGADGTGNGPVVLRGYPAPPSLLTGNSRGMRDEELLQIIAAGRNNMPGYAAQIWREDRWKVVFWVRSCQAAAAAAAASPEAVPPATQSTEKGP